MVAPVEVDEVGVELLIRNELLQEHEVRDRHRLERIKVISRLCHVNQEKHKSDCLFHRWRLDCCHSTQKPINVTKPKCGQKVDPCCAGAPLDQTQLIQGFEE